MNAYDVVVLSRIQSMGGSVVGRPVAEENLSWTVRAELIGIAERVSRRLRAYGVEQSPQTLLQQLFDDLGIIGRPDLRA